MQAEPEDAQIPARSSLSEPDVQAEPEDAHIPAIFKSNKSDSPSIPSKLMFTFPGNLLTLSPLSLERSIFNNSSISLSRF